MSRAVPIKEQEPATGMLAAIFKAATELGMEDGDKRAN